MVYMVYRYSIDYRVYGIWYIVGGMYMRILQMLSRRKVGVITGDLVRVDLEIIWGSWLLGRAYGGVQGLIRCSCCLVGLTVGLLGPPQLLMTSKQSFYALKFRSPF